jgi:hypothetical protein
VRAHSAARPTAVVKATTTWREWPGLWKSLLDQVHAVVERPGRNVMVYLDDVPHVEAGVLLEGDFTPQGNVVRSALPAGETVTVVHRGPWRRIGEAHDAIHAMGLELAGPRWEIYGHHRDDPADQEAEVVYLLRSARPY